MDGIDLFYKLKKQISDHQDSLSNAILNGQVDNHEKYQYMVGQVRAYQTILQEISNLLKNKEQNEDDSTGTIVDISSKTKT
jgi:DNA-binding ferritin-like protein|tara:strand:- start:54 stop:296 length:243 start_codon:yes stop_codon:yes gene_type:complete